MTRRLTMGQPAAGSDPGVGRYGGLFYQTATGPEPDRDLEHLVVIRESSLHDLVLMEGMIRQTMARVSHLPGAEELARVHVQVFKDPRRYGASVERHGKSTFVFLQRSTTLYMICLASAAAFDHPDDTNAFVMRLAEVIEGYRPREVWTVSITRLVRAAEHSGTLISALSRHVEILHAEQEIQPNTSVGKIQMQMLMMIAAAERDFIVQRHTTGRVIQWQRGRWVPSWWPPGYRLEEGRLVLDPDQIEPVRKALGMLADPALSLSEVGRRAGEAGLTTPRLRATYGEDATAASARSPSEVANTVLVWLDVYQHGRYTVRWSNPFPGAKEFAGLEVRPDPETPNGVLIFTYQLPTPDGGWADPATFDAIRRHRNTTPPTRKRRPDMGSRRTVHRGGGQHHHTTAPLVGIFDYTDDGYDYTLLATSKRYYQLHRRPHDPNRRYQGWTSPREVTEHLATIHRRHLHRSVAEGIVAAIRHGVPARIDPIRYQPQPNQLPPINQARAQISHLEGQHREIQRQIQNNLRNAELTDDPETARVFVDRIKTLESQARQLRARIRQLQQQQSQPRLDLTFTTPATLAATALAALAQAPNSAPRQLNLGLKTIIHNATITYHPDRRQATWTLNLELPHKDGTIIIGPITGTVPAKPRRGSNPESATMRKQRRRELAQTLTQLGLPARNAGIVAACPHPQLAETLIAHLTGRPHPQGVDPAWVEHITRIYTNPNLRWQQHQWNIGHPDRQHVLDLLTQLGGTATFAQLTDHGLSPHQIRYLYRTDPTPAGQPILTTQGQGANRIVSLLPCPHCGGWANQSVLTPETQPGVLCPTCRKTPHPDSPTYPSWYLAK